MPLFRWSFAIMASVNELQIDGDDELRAHRAAEASIADALRVERKYSRYTGDSVTAQINRCAGKSATPIDAETAALLRYADHCHRISNGLFDITSGTLRRVWDFRASPLRVPDADAIAAARARIGWRDVEWSDHEIRLPRAGMEIDFGGIGGTMSRTSPDVQN
jgi:FAD:protein FMN transferase